MPRSCVDPEVLKVEINKIDKEEYIKKNTKNSNKK